MPEPTPTPEPTQEPTPSPEPTPTSSEVPDDVEAPRPGLPETGGFGDAAGIAGILAALLVMGAGIMFVRARRMV